MILHHLNKVVSLYEAGQSLDIKVLDYLIIGDGCLVSLKEKGYL
ncbi:JAB domain-containing protein [Turicibacter sanguinis]